MDTEQQLEQMSDRLAELQTQIEVAQQDLDRRDAAFVNHITRLNEVIGAECSTEDLTYDAIRRLREKAERMQSIQDVIDGSFEPDAELVRQFACAIGSAKFDVNSLLTRAEMLASVHSRNAEMYRQLAHKQARIAELEDERLQLITKLEKATNDETATD